MTTDQVYYANSAIALGGAHSDSLQVRQILYFGGHFNLWPDPLGFDSQSFTQVPCSYQCRFVTDIPEPIQPKQEIAKWPTHAVASLVPRPPPRIYLAAMGTNLDLETRLCSANQGLSTDIVTLCLSPTG